MRTRDDLTDQQKMKLLGLASFWSSQATLTLPADRPRAEAAIDEIYALAGYPPPKKRWMSSPMTAAVDAGEDMGDCIAFELEGRLVIERQSIAENYGYDLEELLGDRLTGLIIPVGELSSEERARIEARRLRPPSWHIRRINELIDHRINVICGFYGWSVYAQGVFLRGALDPFEVFAAEVLATVLNITEANPLLAYSVLARSAGFVLPLKERVWLCDRPNVLKRDIVGYLHASNGPALDWNRMMPFYMWHGEEVTQKAVGPVEKLRIWDFGNERNRRARDLMLERYGLERYCREVGKVIHQDQTGTLWRAGGIWAVEVVNGTPELDGSYKRYFLRVPPTMQSARQAVAWTYGLRKRDYVVLVRT